MSRPRADSAEEDYQGQGLNRRKKARLNGEHHDHLQSDPEDDDEFDATKSEDDFMWLSDGDDGDHGDRGGVDLGETGKKANRKPWKVHRPKGDMHDANLYRYYRPDFRELAKEYPGSVGRLSAAVGGEGGAEGSFGNSKIQAEKEFQGRCSLLAGGGGEYDRFLWTSSRNIGDERPASKTEAFTVSLSRGGFDRPRLTGGVSSASCTCSLPRKPVGFRPGEADTFGVHVKDDPETGRATLDWKSPEATRELTRVMLRHDFGVEWDVPLSRLCPPVPNRLNYICWLADIMKLRPSQKGDVNDEEVPGSGQGGGVGSNATLGAAKVEGGSSTARATDMGSSVVIDDEADGMTSERRPIGMGHIRSPRCRGIDIGTGASCIYPLLGAKVAGWSFLATEADAISAEWAGVNVRTNSLQDQITVRIVSPSSGDEAPGPLLSALRDRDGDFDFCMTNPPFFSSEEEAGRNPDTATGRMAALTEVSCPGGEEAFVRAIIRDSLVLRLRVRWYTAMIGRKSNAKKLLKVLREAGVKNTRTTEFFQGKIVRWGLAWSFSTEGMVGDKVRDDPSIKVFSKKKAAERIQKGMRTFSVPIRSHKGNVPADSLVSIATSGTQTEEDGPGGNSTIKIVVPENLPGDEGEVVERLSRSLKSYKQAHVSMTADEADDAAQIGSPNSAAVVAGVACASGTRFRCVARVKQQGKPSVDEMVGSSTPDISPPISFEFELEVHSASKWAGDAARNACVEVSGSFEEGGNRGAFHRLWDNLRHDVLRQNRHWRREMKRAAQGAGGA